MATEVILPQWGMNMLEGTLVQWLKREGDPVSKGEPLVAIETAKISSELEAPEAGVVVHILVKQGETVPVGALLAIIASPQERVPRPAPRAGRAEATAPPGRASQSGQLAGAAGAKPGVQVVPAARRLASRHGLDLSKIRGSGPNGRIIETDVQRAVESLSSALQSGPGVPPLSGVRKTIAARMLESLRTMAQVTLTTEADVTDALALKRDLVGVWRPHRLRPLDQDLVAAAVVRALVEHPALNAVYGQAGLRRADHVNLGIALALEEGLLVGVIRNAEEKDLLAIAQESRALVARARGGALGPDDVTGSTFTITSLGNFDIDAFTPIINPPEVAILGVGRIAEKPLVYRGDITKRSTVFLSLTFDHRALDGVPAAQFLQAVKRRLERPAWMAQGPAKGRQPG